jgi:hypothetical protein
VKTIITALARVRTKDRRFSFSSDTDPSPLAASIRREGLLSPLLLYEVRGRLCLVSGRRRLRALRLLGHATAKARILSEAHTSPFEAWSLNFEETITQRPLDMSEACRAVVQLDSFDIYGDTIVSDYLPLLGLPPKESILGGCRSVAACGDLLLTPLAAGKLTLAAASHLASLAEDDRRSALRQLARTPLTVSQQREWIRLLEDISRRDGLPVKKLLLAASRRAGKAARGADVLQVLRERRYPSLASRKKAFARLLKRFRLPPGMRIEPHPFFERHELKVTFTSRDATSYERALEILEGIRRDPLFETLLPPAKREGS